MGNDILNGKGIRLYNLFPRLVGNMTRWREHLPRLQKMGFNAVYVNPFHYAGFSGSLYAPKDYYKYNPLFVDDQVRAGPSKQLEDFINACHQHCIVFIMDLVINHTSKDSPLIQEHPSWYRWKDGKVASPGAIHDSKWVEWGDLAEIDNMHSSDRSNLWNYWKSMMTHYIELGVDGFRCDAAYQVPTELWNHLISSAQQKKPGCLFLAESLGCTPDQAESLARVGFQYLFNSSKYWDFNAPWGMEQYHRFASVASTISFPESHDTPRLFEETGGNLAMVKRALCFATLFSKGVMIPLGFEYGFRRAMNVVDTYPNWWEQTDVDLSGYIQSLFQVKSTYPVLNSEVGLQIVDQENWYNVFCFKRTLPGQKTVLTMLNKDPHRHQRVFLPDLHAVLGSGQLRDVSPEYAISPVPKTLDYGLRPAEVKIIAVE